MRDCFYDVAIVGAGPAGLAAAVSAKKNGAERVALIERDFRLGGILEQCIHTGFGIKYFNEELTGPEYAYQFIKLVEKLDINVFLNTTVLSIEDDALKIHAVNSKEGVIQITTGAIVLAMGCRERTRFAISIPGTRPAGIYTAGTAQRLMNISNKKVGKKVIIIGSGDIGMIMARRLTLENIKVEAVVEIKPYLTGLARNRVQCLDDFNIPLLLGHTITNINGKLRVENVTIAEVDEDMNPIPDTEYQISCDTVLFSVGLIPENELSKTCGVKLDPITGGPIVDDTMQTDIPGIFACGNVLHVNDLVDNVSFESEITGKYATRFACGKQHLNSDKITVRAGDNVLYVVPQRIRRGEKDKLQLYFRVKKPDKDVRVCASIGDVSITHKKRSFVYPGEIETLELNTVAISSTIADEVIVKVEKQEDKEP